MEQPTAADAYAMAKNDPEMAKRMVHDCPTVVNCQDGATGRTVLHMATEERLEDDAQKYVRLFCGIELPGDTANLLAWAMEHAAELRACTSWPETASLLADVVTGIGGVHFCKAAIGGEGLATDQHTPLTLAVAQNYGRVVQDLLGLVLTSTRMRSRLYVTWSLPDLIKKYPQHVVALLGGLDFAPTPEKPWPHPLQGERALTRADASSRRICALPLVARLIASQCTVISASCSPRRVGLR